MREILGQIPILEMEYLDPMMNLNFSVGCIVNMGFTMRFVEIKL